MPTSDTIVIWLNMAGALTSCLVNLWAGRTGWSDWRWLRYTIAVFSAIYVGAYVVLLSGTYPITVWSPFMRGVSVPVWFIVWSWPAVHSTLVLRRLRSHIEKEPASRVQ